MLKPPPGLFISCSATLWSEAWQRRKKKTVADNVKVILQLLSVPGSLLPLPARLEAPWAASLRYPQGAYDWTRGAACLGYYKHNTIYITSNDQILREIHN